MDKDSVSGWALHAGVIGALALAGIVVEILDRSSSSSGGWISLRGTASFLVWGLVGLYAVASTLTFAFLRARWGVPLAYLAAVPLAAVLGAALWSFVSSTERAASRSQQAAQFRDLSSRFDLVSWSAIAQDGDHTRVTAEIRALRNIEARFDALGIIDNGVVAQAETNHATAPVQRIKAGGSARFERILKHAPNTPPREFSLLFTTWIEGAGGVYGTDGLVTHDSSATQDAIAGDFLLNRPLPAQK
jgi:hypothetical protein